MQRFHWVTVLTVASTLLLAFGMTAYQPRRNLPAQARETRDTTRTTAQYPLRTLRIAAAPLAHLPQMQRAIAALVPETFADGAPVGEANIRLTGFGPLRVGMTLDEAETALGVPLLPLGSNVSGECAYYQPDFKTQAIGFMAVDERIIRIDVWPGSTIATTSGATLGSTEADIHDLYPKQIEESPNPYTQGKFLTFVPQSAEHQLYRLVFETDASGKVVQYRAGQFPAVTWPDGCV